MKKFRTIYEIRVLDIANIDNNDVKLFARRFARNKKTAEKITRHYEKMGREFEINVRPLSSRAREWVNPADVEG